MNKPVNLIPPVRKSVTVARSQADAFRLYTEHFGQWWPANPHSIGGEKVQTTMMECRLGGRVYEKWHDGTEHLWGKVLAWEPPHGIVHSWHLNRDPAKCSEVEVRFVALGSRQTRVELEHRNWENMYGEEAAAMREGYNNGWEGVFIGGFGKFAGKVEETK